MKVPPRAGDVIRVEMVRCGYTLGSLSQETMISQPVLRAVLSGRAGTISTRNLYAMAAAFGYPLSQFIDLIAGTPASGPTEASSAPAPASGPR